MFGTRENTRAHAHKQRREEVYMMSIKKANDGDDNDDDDEDIPKIDFNWHVDLSKRPKTKPKSIKIAIF